MSSEKDLKTDVKDELATVSYPLFKRGFVKIGEKRWFLPHKYVEEGENIYNFEIRPDDHAWIITYPRSDTTMMQELVWLVANDMNFVEAHRRHLAERFPYIDIGTILDDSTVTKEMSAESIDMRKHNVEFVQNQSPRFIKGHMPFELLPIAVNNTFKIIYVAKNPRDVVVSVYNLRKTLNEYQGTFEQFCNHFMNDHTLWDPYWEHVKEAWIMRHKTNMMFIFYDNLIKDLPGNIKKIAAFFDKTYSDEQITKLTEHLRIENFHENITMNQPSPEIILTPAKMMDSWKEIFTPEIEERFSKWIADNLKNTDLAFPN